MKKMGRKIGAEKNGEEEEEEELERCDGTNELLLNKYDDYHAVVE